MEYENNRKGWGLFVLGMVLGLLVSLIIISTILKKSLTLPSENALGVMAETDEDKRIGVKIKALEKIIHDKFYLAEVTDEELETGIYRGMMKALNDPYSEYYTAQELEKLMNDTEGIFYGIGAYLGLDSATKLPMVSKVMRGTPAETADLRTGDLICKVDGREIEGMSLSDAVALVRGPEGTDVLLTIIREGESDFLEVTVTRAKVESPTVDFLMLDEEIAYIKISEFDEVTVDQFADALAMAKGSEMKGLILDLRDNPGGSLSAVVDIAKMILPKGLIVYTEDKNEERMEYRSDGRHELKVPMVVLINQYSASASEILSGAIQDYGMGKLVGTTTYGKGIVQQIVGLGDGSAVKLTISSYFTPKGRNIHGKGIEPDVECEFDAEAYYSTEDHYDNQLEKAEEVLRGLLQGQKP